MDDGIRGGELRGAGPAAVLHAEDVERKRRRADGNDAVFADDAVVFASADEFTGKEQQRAAAAIDQNKLVDGSAGGVLRRIERTTVAGARPGVGGMRSD